MSQSLELEDYTPPRFPELPIAEVGAKPRHGELDPGIGRIVNILRLNGVETYESCEGGSGHSSPEPFVRFHGSVGNGEGIRALGVALLYPESTEGGRRVSVLKRQEGAPANLG